MTEVLIFLVVCGLVAGAFWLAWFWLAPQFGEPGARIVRIIVVILAIMFLLSVAGFIPGPVRLPSLR